MDTALLWSAVVHFIVGLIFCLMISDFLLTLIGQKYYKQHLKKHIESESYELNPIWQKSIREAKYDYRHLIGVIIVVILIMYIYYYGRSKILYEFIIGLVVILNIAVLSKHIQNIAIYKFIGRYPKSVEGKMQINMGLSYYTSMMFYFSFLLLLVVILLFTQTIFILGGLIGIIIHLGRHYFWLQKSLVNITN